MTKWSIAFDTGGKRVGEKPVKAGRRWQLVAFNGPHGRESRGIVDFIAIRKDHREHGQAPFKRGDLFEIVLVQVKGALPRDRVARIWSGCVPSRSGIGRRTWSWRNGGRARDRSSFA